MGMTPEVRFDPAAAVRRDGMRTVASRVGTVTSRCALGALVDATPASTEITAGAAARVTTRVAPAAITAGGSAMVTCAVTDAEGNPVADARPTVATMPTGEGVTVTGNTVAATRAGTYSVACQLMGATGDPATLEVSPALPASLRIARVPDQAVYALGDEVEIASVVQDRYGNRIAMPMLRHTSEPMGGREVRAGRFQYNAEGRYTIAVQVTGPTEMGRVLRETTSFVVDSNGPAIACTGDATMIDLAPGAPLPVRGMLTDTSGVRSVSVGGQMVQAAAGGGFMGSVPSRWGMNFVEVRATDTLGHENVRTCTFLVSDTWQPEATHLTDGVSLQLTQAAMDDGNPVSPITSLDDILQTVLNSSGLSQQLHDSLRAANPLYDDCALRPCVLGVCTCLARERIDYVDRELGGPNTTALTLVDGGLRARVRIENLGVRLRVNGTIDTDAWVRFRHVEVNLTFDVGASGGMPRVSVRAGSVTVDVGTVSVQIVGSGFTATVLNAVVGVVTSLANGIIRDRVSSMVRDYVQTNFNAVLGGIVGGLNVSSLAPTFDVPRLDGSGTVGLGFGLNISNLNSTSARLLAGIGTRFTVTRSTRATPSLGVALPPRDAAEPARSTPATVIVLPAVLNQALHALWRGGEFDASVLGGSGIAASLPRGTTITIATALPPVASLRSDGRVNLDLGALSLSGALPGVHLDAPPGDRRRAGLGGGDARRQRPALRRRAHRRDVPHAGGDVDVGDGEREPPHGPPRHPAEHRHELAQRRAPGDPHPGLPHPRIAPRLRAPRRPRARDHVPVARPAARALRPPRRLRRPVGPPRGTDAARGCLTRAMPRLSCPPSLALALSAATAAAQDPPARVLPRRRRCPLRHAP